MSFNHRTGQYTDDEELEAIGRGEPIVQMHDLIDELAKGDFDLGSSEESGPAETLVCKKCGGDRWLVGKSKLSTFVKCPACGYEILVHDG
jgi:DNA-directed RNA polymerase subunit RPC12/RpoP